MILGNLHLWLSVSPGELGRSTEGRGRTFEQNPTAAFFGIPSEGKGREQERDPNLNMY